MRRLLAAVLALVLSPLVAAPPATAGAVTETLTVWQWNVAGWVMNGGSATNGMVDAAVESILYRDADVVALNEICWGQYLEIQKRLAAAGWPESTNFYRFATAWPKHCAGDAYGNAMFSKQPLGATNWITLTQEPADEGETRNLLCAPVLGKRLRYCVTHLSPYASVTAQAEEVRGQVEAWEDAGETVVIAGDFNSEPGTERMDSWYASSADTEHNPGNRGRHRELDDRGAVCPGYGDATTYRTDDGACGTGVKIDLIFVPENRIVGGYYGDSVGLVTSCGRPCSDHRIIYGRVTLSVGR
ncbi:endonuclease/exonuclease/phosphatase family protein [Actinoplanes sp. GCM10030250]|uniref:endonuclease/exonuclease/phosphatase family protein n=1 Tax=Actinoplanes sp. GCM10030250 TaxID=3273376 RepID=UPI003622FB02